MSLEDSMKALADSNNKLAEAQNKHSEVLAALMSSGVALLTTNSNAAANGAAAATPAKPPKAPKAAPAAAAPAADPPPDDDDNMFGDAPAADTKKYTADDVRAAILKVRDKGGENKNKEAAKGVFGKLGVKSFAEIKEADYGKAVKLAEEAYNAS